MQKIGDIPNTRADSNGEFTDGNVAGGVPPTILPAEWFNTVQRELVNIVEGAGMELEPSDDRQLLAAINKTTTGRLLSIKTFASSEVYTPTAGTRFVVVEVQGGGGGSGGLPATGSSSIAASGAGGSGAYAKSLLTSSFSGVSVIIGAAGAAGASGGGDGGTGGTSSFGSLVVCPGGTSGGTTGSVAVTFPTSRGGSTETSSPTGGNIISSKGKAGAGTTVLNGTVGNTGTGSASPLSAGGTGSTGENGSGASGFINFVSQPARAGFAGGKGLVMVYEYA